MHKDRWKTVVAAMLVWWFASVGESRAQVGVAIVSPEYDRAIGLGAPCSRSLSRTATAITPAPHFRSLSVGVPRNSNYLEYIDRVERAERFGYRIPAPPCGLVPVYSRPRPCNPVVTPGAH